MVELTPYEIERERKIAANRLLLVELGLEYGAAAYLPTKSKPPPVPKKVSKKRKQESLSEHENQDSESRSRKAARTTDVEAAGTLRRSARNAGKKLDYGDIEQDRSARLYRVSTSAQDTMGSEPRDANKRIHDPKKYGSIPSIEVGTWWETRQACSADAIHAPWVGGIACGPKGAYSVALSGGYDDDVDLGYAFTYTGSGGRDLKGTKDKPKNLRTAPQSSDQTFENHFNKALKISAENGNPVRVIRGFKLRSPYAPAEGYRYDGLYTVTKAWQEVGLNTKYLVCKYAFKRMPGQPPLLAGTPENDSGKKRNKVHEEANTDGETEDEEVSGDEKLQTSSSQETESSATQVDAEDCSDGE
ncbi:hypothetical protein M0805_004266 [Coniferiporia weirii]|nr:hypothetical protein M0805_004266 [Coniferiporia weirii]